MAHELQHDGYLVSDDPSLLDTSAIHAYLTTSYWAEGIPMQTVQRSLANSLCVGVYKNRVQVGLARAISDYTTFAYLCDVYVLEPHRGRGLSKAMLQLLSTHPRLQGLRRQHLVTQDAHGLYAQFGFAVISQPDRHMEKRDPEVYRRGASAPR